MSHHCVATFVTTSVVQGCLQQRYKKRPKAPELAGQLNALCQRLEEDETAVTSDMSANPEFLCPITGEVMQDPFITSVGHSYERAAIEAWLEVKDTDPLTNTILCNKALVPNHALRNAIGAWLGT